MRILFTRHGESEANILRIISNRDLPHHLTERGRAQAADLAENLAEWPVASIFSSPILRARETAAILSARLAIPFTCADALREFDCGDSEGRGDDAAWADHDAALHAWLDEGDSSYRIPPDGESLDDIHARFIPYLEELIAESASLAGDVLLVSHGSLLNLMLPTAFSNVSRSFVWQHPLRNCDLVVANLIAGRLVCTTWAGMIP